ncbi:Mobile element protein [Candidatus Enterovibrio escicola]|uniref:Mobile element protein n=1 Tax=Candidatus Enterovibrio escicola TaxID=1927127 RepID=A0A2A5T292_9GAMM|nr:Mobile element protein [Candidatus Enterovibrio escacola]
MGINNLDAVFVDFCQIFLPTWKKHLMSSGFKQRNKPFLLAVSEVITIVIAFHQ